MHIYRIDTYSLLQAIVTDGAHYGFTDVSDPCLNTAVSPPTLCSNPYTNFFWDIEHPTIFGHAFFAVAAERRSTDKANSHRLCASELQAGKRKLACHAPRRTKRTMQHQHIDRAIDYIEFTTPDLPTIKKFYGSGFDWTFQDWGEEYSSFSDGRVDGGFARGDSPLAKACSSSSIRPVWKRCSNRCWQPVARSSKTHSHFPEAAAFTSPIRQGMSWRSGLINKEVVRCRLLCVRKSSGRFLFD